MRARFLIPVLAAASVAVPAAAAEPPSIRAEQARERAVLAEVDGINLNLERVVQAWDGARVELGAVQRDLRANEWRLRVARRNLAVAQRRVEQRLVVIYVEGQPSAVDVFDGARSLSDLIDRIEAAQVLSRQDAEIARQAVSFDRAVRRREAVLRGERRQRAATVSRLSGRRQLIASSLAREQSLLASIHTSIQRLEAEQAARERRLAAAARARVAYQVALARQRAAAARRSRAHAPAPAPASRSRPKPAAPAPAARPAAPAPTTTASSPPPAPAPPAPAARSSASGHPQAAAIAARYLGVPYRWGGASPAGFDCSGLVTYVYAQLGISLPHYTVSQWAATIPIPTSALQPGDLVFFAGLSHVGIYIGNNQIIHAPHTGTVVQVASLSGWFASSLDGARRVP